VLFLPLQVAASKIRCTFRSVVSMANSASGCYGWLNTCDALSDYRQGCCQQTTTRVVHSS